MPKAKKFNGFQNLGLNHSHTSLTPNIKQVDVSTSKYKLSTPLSTLVKPDSNVESNIVVTSEENLLKLLKKLHTCCGELKITRMTGNNQGVYIPRVISCDGCEFTHTLNESRHCREGKNLNKALSFATISSGFDKANIDQFLELLGLAHLPDSFYDLYIQEINHAVHDVVQKVLTENREYVKTHYPDGEITVKFDASLTGRTTTQHGGTYQTRGFQSRLGVMWVSHADSDKILDFIIKCKKCHVCEQHRPKGVIRNHICATNYEGSSTEMERKAALEMFTRAPDFGLKYRVMVSDGDSKAYIDIFDVYGVCKSCQDVKSKFTNIRDSSFSDWVRSEEYATYVAQHESLESTCKVVYKRDCCNHSCKNFRKALESFAKSGEKIEGLKSITRCKHGLGQTAIEKMAKRFRSVIIACKVTGTPTESDVAAALLKMKAGIMAILFHSTMIEDPEVRHQWCPKGQDSWCPYRRGVINWDGNKSHHLNPLLLPHLTKIFESRSTESYLRRVVTGYNQNSLESINQLIWKNVSKSKFHGYKRVEIAVGLALLQFEKGGFGQILVQQRLGLSVSKYQIEKAEARDDCRIYHAERRLTKAKRLFDDVKADAKSKELTDEEINPGYQPGGCDVPALTGPLVEVSPNDTAADSFESSYIAISYPGGVDVAFVHKETESQVQVAYLMEKGSGLYALYDPPYEETRDKAQIISKLSWPKPKGFSLRELCLLVFDSDELKTAQDIWRCTRSKRLKI